VTRYSASAATSTSNNYNYTSGSLARVLIELKALDIFVASTYFDILPLIHVE